MGNTLKELKKFIVIPEDLFLDWILAYSQEEINTNEVILTRVRTYLRIYEQGLLVYEDEINLNKDNPEQEKFKQWVTP